MENTNQIDGYVYVARIIDHGGKFVNGYHKIGLSKQYKIRETQLNSTHLPFDVLMVRVFETTNMKQLESMLHICFEDYRVVKEYDYRKNITTEWFDVNDIDTFNDRIDKFTELMSIYGTKEIDVSRSIDSDTTMTSEEKEQTKESISRAKGSYLRIIMDGNDISKIKAVDGFREFFLEVYKIKGNQLKLDFTDIIFDKQENYTTQLGDTNLYLKTEINTQRKKNSIEKVTKKYNLNCVVEMI